MTDRESTTGDWTTRWKAAVSAAEDDPSAGNFEALDALRREHILAASGTSAARRMVRGFIRHRGHVSRQELQEALTTWYADTYPDKVKLDQDILRWMREDELAGLVRQTGPSRWEALVSAAPIRAELRAEAADDSVLIGPGRESQLRDWLVTRLVVGGVTALDLPGITFTHGPSGLRVRIGPRPAPAPGTRPHVLGIIASLGGAATTRDIQSSLAPAISYPVTEEDILPMLTAMLSDGLVRYSDTQRLWNLTRAGYVQADEAGMAGKR